MTHSILRIDLRFRGLHGKKSNFSLVESATDRALSAVLDGNAHYYKATNGGSADVVGCPSLRNVKPWNPPG